MNQVLEQFLSDPSKIGVISLMAMAIAAFMRGWIVTAAVHADTIARYEVRIMEVAKERDEFKAMVLHAATTTDRALTIAQKSAA